MISLRFTATALAAVGCTLLPALASAQPGPSPEAPAPAAAAPAPAPAAAPAPAPAAAPAPAPAAAAAPADDESNPTKNSVYGELLGAGLVYSANYERMVTPDLGIRVGFGYISASSSVATTAGIQSSSVTYLFFPVTASYIGLRSGKSSLEVGGGATILSVSGSGSFLGAHASGSAVIPYGDILLGYRLQPTGGKAGFMFRVGAMALIGKGLGLSSTTNPNNIGAIPWGYISFGASF